MRAAFGMGNLEFKPNAKKMLVLEHVALVCIALTLSTLLLIYGGVEGQEAISVFGKIFLFVLWSFFSYALLAFIVTPIGWITVIYWSRNEKES